MSGSILFKALGEIIDSLKFNLPVQLDAFWPFHFLGIPATSYLSFYVCIHLHKKHELTVILIFPSQGFFSLSRNTVCNVIYIIQSKVI